MLAFAGSQIAYHHVICLSRALQNALNFIVSKRQFDMPHFKEMDSSARLQFARGRKLLAFPLTTGKSNSTCSSLALADDIYHVSLHIFIASK